ncbi:MAG: hypothetical protein HXY27_02100 [Hydrogenophilaceae bacterium]|nr:hypothetical protein [Hydrogenophilaceae bacterium]
MQYAYGKHQAKRRDQFLLLGVSHVFAPWCWFIRTPLKDVREQYCQT